MLVTGCTRCGQDHEIEFQEFKNGPAGKYTHWGLCENTGDPVLLYFTGCALSDELDEE